MREQAELDFAITKWQREVDAEAIMLIQMGTPLYEAELAAVSAIARRRRAEHADKSGG